MDSAYLYIRVSTDEQKRTGFSLPEQEDKLTKYCDQNHIKINGIFREDFSARDFNRPEWKALIKTIRNNKAKPQIYILFVKWDRFSRSIEYAFQMLGILRNLNVIPLAIDQPIDFEIPESIVTLAVYLAIPEAENSRRGKNVSDGIRRSKIMGFWPSKAPMGYINQSTAEGRKIIVPKQPQANLIKWAFEQFSNGTYGINQVRNMVCQKGLQCSKNNFWKILHNSIYCGIISIKANKGEEQCVVKAIHEPLISESLFEKVQNVFKIKGRDKCNKPMDKKVIFPLRGIIKCPFCGRFFTASISKGKVRRYRYYHCTTPMCKGRYRADSLEASFEFQLKKMYLSSDVFGVLSLILEDENLFKTNRSIYEERKLIQLEISQQNQMLARGRRLFLTNQLDYDDFKVIKQECSETNGILNERLIYLARKLEMDNSNKIKEDHNKGVNLFELYKNLDVLAKGMFVNIFKPIEINIGNRIVETLNIQQAIKKIIVVDKDCYLMKGVEMKEDNKATQLFLERKVSKAKVISLLASKQIVVDEEEAEVILDFLYSIASTLQQQDNLFVEMEDKEKSNTF